MELVLTDDVLESETSGMGNILAHATEFQGVRKQEKMWEQLFVFS